MNWINVKNYEGIYKVNEFGDVLSVRRNIILKAAIDGNGYKTVSLCVDSKPKTHHVHRLVAQAFLNHDGGGYELVVDHIDENKINNHYKNLQLLSVADNIAKSRK